MKTWKRILLVFGLGFLFLLFSPTLLDFKPRAVSLPPPLPLTGVLKANNKLSEAERLADGKINAPECVVIHKGEIITGTADGHIVKVQNNEVIPLVRIGRDCNYPFEEKMCGRPLGLRMWKDGLLYIVDACYGIHSLNLSNGQVIRLLSINTEIEGQKMMLPDDMDIDDNGNIYLSDASTKWDFTDLIYIIAENQMDGRVIKYNIYTGEREVILQNLHFPNGLQVSKDGQSLLICESNARRILRYHLKGRKKGTLDVFIDKLPGEPDNIRLSPRGTYWVALYLVRNNQFLVQLYDKLTQYPLINGMIMKIIHAMGSMLVAFSELYSSHEIKEFAYKFRHAHILYWLTPKYGIVIELDETGRIIRSLQSPDGSISRLSSVIESDGYLYLGSFVNQYLGRYKL